MKKVIMVVLCLALVLASCFVLVGCGETENVKVINIQLTEEFYAFAINKDDAKLLEDVNGVVNELKADGTIDAISAKYFSGEKVDGIPSAKKDSNKNQLVVATNAAFPPFEYTIGEKFAGIDMEIAKIIADKLGKELVIIDMEFDSVFLEVKDAKCDIGMAGLTVNEERQKSVTFSESYYKASQMVIVRESDTRFDDCKTKEDVENVLKGLEKKGLRKPRAGYQNGTTGQFYVTGDAEWEFDGYKNLKGKGFPNGALAVKKLQQGGLDLVIIDEMPAATIVRQLNK